MNTKVKKETLIDLFVTFAKIGAFTFGGGYAMLSLLDHECVENKKWLKSDEMMNLTVIAESTPGPIAINCATYTGYKVGGVIGSVFATIGMVLPSFCIILIISSFLDKFLKYQVVENAFRGIRVAVAILIIQVAIKMIRKMMTNANTKIQKACLIAIFAALVLILNFLGISFSTIYLIIIAGIIGFAVDAFKKGGMWR